MNQQSHTSPASRRVWIGSGIAAVVTAVVVALGTGGMPLDQDVCGTVVPAARYLAPQNTAQAVRIVAQQTDVDDRADEQRSVLDGRQSSAATRPSIAVQSMESDRTAPETGLTCRKDSGH